jgi:hypothetical protein
MFNQKASDQERQIKLENLIRQQYELENSSDNNDDDKDEVYDDEELNEVIARNDTEFELF